MTDFANDFWDLYIGLLAGLGLAGCLILRYRPAPGRPQPARRDSGAD